MKRLPQLVLILTALCIPNAAAEPDDLEARVVAGRWALRWDDPECRLQRTDGAGAPRRTKGAFLLERGEEVQLQVPARAHLRLLASRRRPLRPEELSAWIGNGTGLALALEPTVAGGELHLHSPLDHPALVRLRRAEDSRPPDGEGSDHDQALKLRLFVSREVVPPAAVRYREPIALPGATRRVGASRTGGSEAFATLPAGSAMPVALQGPLRLLLTSRLDEPAGDAGWDGEYHIRARLDGKHLRTVEHLSVPDYRRPVKLDGLARVLGRPERGFLEVPAGSHQLTLEANADLLVRLAARPRPDFLFPGLNRPRALDAEHVPPPVCTPPWLGDQSRQTPAAIWCRALRLARSNRSRPGGLAATGLLRTQAATRPELPGLYGDALRVRGRYSFYRDLLPREPTTVIRHAAFPTPRLLAPGEARRLRLDEALSRSLAERMPAGPFVAIDGGTRTYRLPRRDTDGSLRLAVVGSGELWLQLDGMAPSKLQARARQPDESFQLEPAWESQGPAGASLIAPRRQPAPLVAAASIELALPAAVPGFRLWSASGRRLWVAAAYRASAPYRLPERGYLDLLERVGVERALGAFTEAIDGGHGGSVDDPDIAALQNAWLPSIAALNARYRRFSSNVDTGEPVPLAAPIDGGEAQRLRGRAAAEGGYAAVQGWARLAQRGRGAARSRALLQLATALDGVGEAYLAERLWRSLVLRDLPGAASALAEHYQAREDADALQTLAAVQLRRHPGRETLAAYVSRLAEQGRSREVLELGLLLAREQPLREDLRSDLLDAALDEGWDRTFARLVQRLPAPGRHLWQGRQAAARGDWRGAREHFLDAGARRELRTLRAATKVRAGLAKDRAQLRAAALADWAQLQAAGSGRRRWRRAPWLATAGGGIELLDAELGRVQSRLLAQPEAPVRLQVTGPARIRLEVRLLHGPRQERLEDWLLIREGDRARRIPLPTSRAVPGLDLVGSEDRPGMRFEHILDLPAGEHTLAVRAQGAPLVVGPALEQPLVAWLGPRIPTAVALVQSGGWGRDPRALAAGAQSARPLTLLATTGERRLPARPLPTTAGAWPAPPRAAPADAPLPHGREPALARMSAWLWQRERSGTLPPAVLADASRMLARHPGDARLAQLGQRLLRGARWERIEQLEQGAGLRFRELSVWQPDSPSLRGRLALLEPPLPGETFLIGEAELAMDVFNPIRRPLHFELRLDGPGFLPLEDARVVIAVDGAALHSLPLSAHRPRGTLDLDLAAGTHHVRVTVPEPVVHQVVRVRVRERQGEHLVPVEENLQRSYQIATRAEPLVAHVEGPAWLRLDEWRDGETPSTFRDIAAGWQELLLVPEEGREERLLRLFVLRPAAADPEPERAAPRPMPVAGRPLPAPPLEPGAGAAPISPAAGPDIPGLPLGGQEDGTWSLRLDLVQSAGIEGDEEQGIPDEYLELGATYRAHLPRWRAWWRGEALNRWRDDGRPTLGLRTRFFRQPERLPFDYDLRADWYGQSLPGGLAWSANISASLSRRMELDPKSYQHARLTVFARHLSEDRAPSRTQVDQDVYSDYKRDHRYGLRYAHTLVRHPWRDSQWRLGMRLGTNERLYSLDYASLNVGARQRLGAFGLSGQLRWRRYLADDDRSSALDRRRLTLGIDWEAWQAKGHRLELGLHWVKDFDTADYSLLLGLRWHASRGRVFRDFAPQELAFRDLRAWRLWDLDDDR